MKIMKCMNCGYDNAENAGVCQGCGSILAVEQHSLPKRMLELLNDNIFMILCILYSVSIGFSFVSESFSVVRILMLIFLWMVFSKSKNGAIPSNSVSYISGTIFASYVIRLVLCCIVGLCGLLLAILTFAVDTTRLWNMIDHGIRSFIGADFGLFTELAKFYLLLISAALILFAVIGLCLNVFGWRTIHRFVQSIYKSLERGQINLVRCDAAQTWMMVFGILYAISAVIFLKNGSIASFFDNGCLSAVFIMGRVLVRKYFGDIEFEKSAQTKDD